MNKNIHALRAQETLKIIENGFYLINDIRVDIKEQILHSIKNSKLYRDEDWRKLAEELSDKIGALNYNTEIKVEHTTVLEVAAAMAKDNEKTGCLNFASAKNPGGGFLGGAIAQEESLALSSTLYPTLTEHFDMYEYNRARKTLLYSDYMIYSPHVSIFRDDKGDLLNCPYKLSFITSPAVNVGAIKNNRPEELQSVEPVMLSRMDKVLALFVSQNITHIILGAWGCGVFQNDPNDIARYFKSFLTENGKYSKSFETIVFAIFDKSKALSALSAFQNAFKGV